MKKYKDFSIEDLVLDAYFRNWVNDQIPIEDTFWNNLIFENNEIKEKIQVAKEIVKSIEIKHGDLSESEINHEIKRIYQSAVEKKPTKMVPINRQVFRIAASVVLLVGIGWLIRKSLQSEPLTNVPSIAKSSQDEYVRLANDGVNATKHTLPDGSTVLLKKKSELVFQKNFEKTKREVKLKGEAVFDIQKDENRPFLVITEKVVTKVLGTKFDVVAKESDSNILVAVKSGKVGVSFENKKGLSLLPNQSVFFNKQTGDFIKFNSFKSVKKNDFFLESFNFDKTPLTKVFEEIEKEYDVMIIYDSEKVKNCYVSGILKNESIEKILNFVAKETSIKYEKFGGKILILSTGC